MTDLRTIPMPQTISKMSYFTTVKSDIFFQRVNNILLMLEGKKFKYVSNEYSENE